MNFGKLKMYVGGELIDSINKSEKTILCPANNEPIAELSWADKFDAEKALNAAKSGFRTWSKFKPEERKGWMNKFKDAVVAKGSNARIHFGIIAQDLNDAFTAEGLDAADYGMFCSDTWTDSDGNSQTRLAVRYSELLAFIIAGI